MTEIIKAYGLTGALVLAIALSIGFLIDHHRTTVREARKMKRYFDSKPKAGKSKKVSQREKELDFLLGMDETEKFLSQLSSRWFWFIHRGRCGGWPHF